MQAKILTIKSLYYLYRLLTNKVILFCFEILKLGNKLFREVKTETLLFGISNRKCDLINSLGTKARYWT